MLIQTKQGSLFLNSVLLFPGVQLTGKSSLTIHIKQFPVFLQYTLIAHHLYNTLATKA